MKYYIYFLLRFEEVVYIGQTQSPNSRISNHKKDKIFHSHRIIECPVDKLNYYEERWINRFSPLYNKESKPHYNRGAKKHVGRRDIRIEKFISDMARQRSRELGLSFNGYINKLLIESCRK